MKFAVIGAGLYGLHIASSLKSVGLDVTVYEKNDSLLSCASGNNQFRLHLGFHYARNFRTRTQSREGYFRFLDKYGEFVRTIEENWYLIPDGDSFIDFSTYKLIMMSSGLNFVEKTQPETIKHPCGALCVDEKIILPAALRDHFSHKLHGILRLGENAEVHQGSEKIEVNGSKYDYCVDCTWGHLSNEEGCFYESTILLYYRNKNLQNNHAYTFVDGPLCSLYPTEQLGLFTLSSVPHTPIGSHSTSMAARREIESISSHDVGIKRLVMEKQMMRYYPDFLDDFEYVGPQLSIKTKPFGKDDDRSCYMKKQGRLIKCLSGKIDNIFYASSEVFAMIDGGNP
jgi:hypothetical protein